MTRDAALLLARCPIESLRDLDRAAAAGRKIESIRGASRIRAWNVFAEMRHLQGDPAGSEAARYRAAELSGPRALPSWNVGELLESCRRAERPSRSGEER